MVTRYFFHIEYRTCTINYAKVNQPGDKSYCRQVRQKQTGKMVKKPHTEPRYLSDAEGS